MSWPSPLTDGVSVIVFRRQSVQTERSVFLLPLTSVSAHVRTSHKLLWTWLLLSLFFG